MLSLIDGETDVGAILSNVGALLNQTLDNINWVGFYLLADNELVLGPFQGNVACYRIPVGRGVCGSAIADKKSLRIADVHEFAGHIACDSASRSELVVPLLVDGRAVGVLDIDSPSLARFDSDDQAGIEGMVLALGDYLTANSEKSSCSYAHLGK